ncbi:hypothetical protein ElyMa_005524100 [Elysia marginata]|uniref:Uncharacterized protein n=1 Tax=Elysia marginata TaxID=1093978 RepID=A0AAV4EXN1_9GAST|nr:hypothetical protein ElyMa_005524100 [Elysia marginata]
MVTAGARRNNNIQLYGGRRQVLLINVDKHREEEQRRVQQQQQQPLNALQSQPLYLSRRSENGASLLVTIQQPTMMHLLRLVAMTVLEHFHGTLFPTPKESEDNIIAGRACC